MFFGLENTSGARGSFVKNELAPRSSMRKIKPVPTGVWQKITWRPKG